MFFFCFSYFLNASPSRILICLHVLLLYDEFGMDAIFFGYKHTYD